MFKIFGIVLLCFIFAIESQKQKELDNSALFNSNHTTSGNCTRSCLIFAVGDILKGQALNENNTEEIKMLMHFSFKNCPGLLSTFEIFGKLLEIKRTAFYQTLEWIKLGYGCGNVSTVPSEKTTFGPIFRTTKLPPGKK